MEENLFHDLLKAFHSLKHKDRKVNESFGRLEHHLVRFFKEQVILEFFEEKFEDFLNQRDLDLTDLNFELNKGRIMSEVDDLKVALDDMTAGIATVQSELGAAASDVQTKVDALNAQIVDLQAQFVVMFGLKAAAVDGTVKLADLDPLVASAQAAKASVDNLSAAVGSLDAVVNPPAPPPAA